MRGRYDSIRAQQGLCTWRFAPLSVRPNGQICSQDRTEQLRLHVRSAGSYRSAGELSVFKTPTLYVGTIESAALKVIKDQLRYLEIAVAQDEKALKKHIGEAEFEMFVIKSECSIKNVEARLKEIDPTLTNYASTGETALIELHYLRMFGSKPPAISAIRARRAESKLAALRYSDSRRIFSRQQR